MKKIGKYVLTAIVVILIAVVVLIVAARFLNRGQGSGDLMQPAVLPAEYSITYQVAQENGKLTEVTMERDADGYIYFASAAEELLFVPSGAGYLLYRPNLSGVFLQVDDTLYTEDYVEEATAEFQEYVQKSSLRSSQSAEFVEEQVICGRACDLYRIDMTLGAYEQDDLLAIDQETGVCMRWDIESQVDGYELSAEGSFSCVQFETENNELSVRAKAAA